jgi:hypothetical protein
MTPNDDSETGEFDPRAEALTEAEQRTLRQGIRGILRGTTHLGATADETAGCVLRLVLDFLAAAGRTSAAPKAEHSEPRFRHADVGQWFEVVVDEPSGAQVSAGTRVQLQKLCDDSDCDPRYGVITGRWHVLPEHLRSVAAAPPSDAPVDGPPEPGEMPCRGCGHSWHWHISGAATVPMGCWHMTTHAHGHGKAMTRCPCRGYLAAAQPPGTGGGGK